MTGTRDGRDASDGRVRRRLETRERLYHTAVRLFVERGYADTTMDEIAEAAGTSRRTAFNHFPAKRDITIEWAARRRARAADAARLTEPEAGPALHRLRAYFQEMAVITEETPDETRQLALGWLGAHGPVRHRTWMSPELSAWVEAGRRDGPADPVAAAEILYDVYLGALFRWMRATEPPPGRFAADLARTIDLVLAGLDRPEPHPVEPHPVEPLPAQPSPSEPHPSGPLPH